VATAVAAEQPPQLGPAGPSTGRDSINALLPTPSCCPVGASTRCRQPSAWLTRNAVAKPAGGNNLQGICVGDIAVRSLWKKGEAGRGGQRGTAPMA
jgi:hypothetical protein